MSLKVTSTLGSALFKVIFAFDTEKASKSFYELDDVEPS